MKIELQLLHNKFKDSAKSSKRKTIKFAFCKRAHPNHKFCLAKWNPWAINWKNSQDKMKECSHNSEKDKNNSDYPTIKWTDWKERPKSSSKQFPNTTLRTKILRDNSIRLQPPKLHNMNLRSQCSLNKSKDSTLFLRKRIMKFQT